MLSISMSGCRLLIMDAYMRSSKKDETVMRLKCFLHVDHRAYDECSQEFLSVWVKSLLSSLSL